VLLIQSGDGDWIKDPSFMNHVPCNITFPEGMSFFDLRSSPRKSEIPLLRVLCVSAVRILPQLSHNFRKIPSNSPLLKGRIHHHPPLEKGD
jgi:hypothetical protein